jgi:hypothetical protein
MREITKFLKNAKVFGENSRIYENHSNPGKFINFLNFSKHAKYISKSAKFLNKKFKSAKNWKILLKFLKSAKIRNFKAC